MSQEKVERYKENKANRKKEVQKKKTKKILAYVIAIVIAAGVVVWLVTSVIRSSEAAKPRASVEVDVSAISEFETNTASEEQE